MDALKVIDIFGIPVRLNIQKNNSYTSFTGGLFTILIIILSSLAFAAFGRDLFEKKQPSILYQKSLNANPYFLVTKNFTMMFALVDNDSNPLTDVERKFNIYLQLGNTNSSRLQPGQSGTTLRFTDYEMERCKPKNLKPEAEKFLVTSVENYWCLRDDYEVPLMGVYGTGLSQYFRIQFDICKNSTKNNNTCLPNDVIYNSLGIFNTHYVFQDSLIDNYNYKKPSSERYISSWAKSNGNSYCRYFFWFKNVDYQSDDGWILEDTRKESILQHDSIEVLNLFQEKSKVFFSHIVSIKGISDVYNRSYLKIQGVFAYIGGFINFFRLFIGYAHFSIVKPDYLKVFLESYFGKSNKYEVFSKEIYNDTNICSKLENSQLKADKKDEINLGSCKKDSKSISFTNKSLSVNNYFDQSSTHNKMVNNFNNFPSILVKKNLKIMKSNKTQKSKKIDLQNYNFCEKFIRCCACNNSKLKVKNKLLDKVEEIYNKEISLERLGKINKKVQILEYLLLDEDHVNIIKYLDIPFKNKTNIDDAKTSYRNLNEDIINKPFNTITKKLKQLIENR